MTAETRESDQHVRPREPATGEFEGEPFVLSPRDVFASTHPIVRAHPNLFQPIEPNRERPQVETTTAAPGEKRGAARAKRQAS